MTSLADELLEDFDGLSDEDEEQPIAGPSSLKRKANGDPEEDVDMSDQDGEAGEGEEESAAKDGALVLEGGIKPAEELDAEDVENMDLGGVGDVNKLAKLDGSKRMAETIAVSF